MLNYGSVPIQPYDLTMSVLLFLEWITKLWMKEKKGRSNKCMWVGSIASSTSQVIHELKKQKFWQPPFLHQNSVGGLGFIEARKIYPYPSNELVKDDNRNRGNHVLNVLFFRKGYDFLTLFHWQMLSLLRQSWVPDMWESLSQLAFSKILLGYYTFLWRRWPAFPWVDARCCLHKEVESILPL